MNTDWKAFLHDSGAEFGPEPICKVTSFGNAEREKRITPTGSILCDLSHLGLISATGEEASTFLQGQLTNDLNQITNEQAGLGGYCTPKGRLLALFNIFKRDDVIYLQLPRELLESTQKRLSMFIMRSKVTLDDASHEFIRFGISGAEAENDLKEILGSVPENAGDTLQHDGITLIRVTGPLPRFQAIGNTEDCRKLWDRLNVRAAPVGAASWDLLDILAGIPQIVEATKEAFIPQMANLEIINGISFKKGCYTGQEIVARTHYLGTIKRRMFRIQLSATATPEAGNAVYSSSNTREQSIGSIVTAAPSPDGGWDALAVLVVKHVEDGSTLTLNELNGEVISVTEQPYEFPSDKKESS